MYYYFFSFNTKNLYLEDIAVLIMKTESELNYTLHNKMFI